MMNRSIRACSPRARWTGPRLLAEPLELTAIEGKTVRPATTGPRDGRRRTGLRFRREQRSGSRSGGGRRESQRNHGHPRAARETRRRPQPRRRRGHHRRHRLQSQDRSSHPRRCSRLSARRQRNQPNLQADIEAALEAAGKGQVRSDVDTTKATAASKPAPSRYCARSIWLDGDRRFPAKVRFVDARATVRVEARTELKDRSRFDTRHQTASSSLSAARLSQTIRGHGASRTRRTGRST